MGKIKSFITKILSNLKSIYEKFPITMILIIIATVVGSVGLENDLFKQKIIGEIIFTLFISAIGSLFTEIHFINRKKIKPILFFVSILIGLFFDFAMFGRLDFIDDAKVEIYIIPIL